MGMATPVAMPQSVPSSICMTGFVYVYLSYSNNPYRLKDSIDPSPYLSIYPSKTDPKRRMHAQ